MLGYSNQYIDNSSIKADDIINKQAVVTIKQI